MSGSSLVFSSKLSLLSTVSLTTWTKVRQVGYQIKALSGGQINWPKCARCVIYPLTNFLPVTTFWRFLTIFDNFQRDGGGLRWQNFQKKISPLFLTYNHSDFHLYLCKLWLWHPPITSFITTIITIMLKIIFVVKTFNSTDQHPLSVAQSSALTLSGFPSLTPEHFNIRYQFLRIFF